MRRPGPVSRPSMAPGPGRCRGRPLFGVRASGSTPAPSSMAGSSWTPRAKLHGCGRKPARRVRSGPSGTGPWTPRRSPCRGRPRFGPGPWTSSPRFRRPVVGWAKGQFVPVGDAVSVTGTMTGTTIDIIPVDGVGVRIGVGVGVGVGEGRLTSANGTSPSSLYHNEPSWTPT